MLNIYQFLTMLNKHLISICFLSQKYVAYLKIDCFSKLFLKIRNRF